MNDQAEPATPITGKATTRAGLASGRPKGRWGGALGRPEPMGALVAGLDPANGDAHLPDEVRARVEVAQARAAAKVADVQANPRAQGLLDAARSARSARQRVVWLQRWGSAWAEPLAQVSACRRGCAHCCHLPVAITSVEAHLIGEVVGREPARVTSALRLKDAALDPTYADRQRAAEQRVVGTACPFLKHGECSIYEHRPFACRTHLSLDDDDLLCRLIDGVDVPVPYANASMVYGVFLASQPNEQLADIREFFPGGAEATNPAGSHR